MRTYDGVHLSVTTYGRANSVVGFYEDCMT